MKVAQVIVDVPSMATNQPFDYLIPEKYKSILAPGMRVIIPFGPRKITGFVVATSTESSYDNLRELIEVLDITPVLTDELLKLGQWLAKETLCLYITVYQAMLPQLLKATYDKELIKTNKVPLSPELNCLFGDQDQIPFSAIEKANISYYQLQQDIKSGALTVNYLVQSRVTKKYTTYIKPAVPVNKLKEALQRLPKNAIRQYDVLAHFIEKPEPIEQRKLINSLQVSRQTIKALEEKLLLSFDKQEVYRSPYDVRQFEQTKPLTLTEEQQAAILPIQDAIFNNKDEVFLLHGVTGSGKTEIYLQAIQNVIAQGKEAIVLVPEISLTPQMVKRFKGRFGRKVAVLHSALSAGEKYDEWRKIQRQEVKVVVGARSAIFAPFENIGIIIIDEEHEHTYKQEDQPRYHARDVAIWRATYHNCPVVLGSATPTLESYARADKGIYHLLTLSKRTNEQAMPEVQIVDMRQELHAGNRTMFSRDLTDAIKERIHRKEQIVLLLNRRGYSTFVMCRDCGHVNECPHCDIALTFHKQSEALQCHYCSYVERVPTICPSCSSDLIRYFGTGTQRVEEALTELIPEASVIRMDVDTTRRKGAHERLLQKFADQEAHILLGTQMIAKGLDFENVTLVGVLTADSMLHLPDFRSSEKTFQLLTQVSGRAGRHALPGQVVVQTYTPEHYSIKLASEYDFEQFYKKEMHLRRTFQYPPYVYLSLITVSHSNRLKVIQITQQIVQLLLQYVQKHTTILGPTPSPLARIKNRYRYQCMIKYKREPHIHEVIQRIIDHFKDAIQKEDVSIVVDMQPYQLM